MKTPLHMDEFGNQVYKVDGRLHREDGPAHTLNSGDKFWYQNGKRHREDGPAIEFISGTKYWYFHGKYIDCNSQEEFLALINPNLTMFW
jgi:hypothetical protein